MPVFKIEIIEVFFLLPFSGREFIFSRQASLARQAFLITPLHGARLKTGKNAYAKK